jgi:hypothetical protein
MLQECVRQYQSLHVGVKVKSVYSIFKKLHQGYSNSVQKDLALTPACGLSVCKRVLRALCGARR